MDGMGMIHLLLPSPQVSNTGADVVAKSMSIGMVRA